MVTGVAGFIGSRLAASLLASGHDVFGIDRLSDYYDPDRKRANIALLSESVGFSLSTLDLCEMTPANLPRDLDVVFHLAAQPGVRGSWGNAFPTYVRDNIVSTQRLLECVAALTAPPRVVYSSSSSVYGAAASYPTRTTALPQPQSPYGVTKLAGESLVGAYSLLRGVPAVSLRYFTVYGPGQRPDMAIHRIINAAVTGQPFQVFGDGNQVRDFTFVDDVVHANLLAATAPSLLGHEIFNVAGGAETSLKELVDLIEQVLDRPLRVERVAGAPGDPARTSADTSGTLERLKWTPQVVLRDGITEQAAWQLQALESDKVPA
jgi:nucleoside-diphosphate-sugar epimerase